MAAFATNACAQGVAIQDTFDPRRARIEGQVEDENGQPLGGAIVTATPPGPIAAVLPNTLTDAKGRFALAGLLPGHTYLHASKVEAFYPDAIWGLWDAGQGSAEAELKEGQLTSGILLKAFPGGRFEVKAINATTGTSIDAISVRIERDGSPNRWMEGTRQGNTWLVPAVPIRLRVDAKGFQSAWYSADSGGNPSALSLAPRQVLDVTVSLRPLPK